MRLRQPQAIPQSESTLCRSSDAAAQENAHCHNFIHHLVDVAGDRRDLSWIAEYGVPATRRAR
jgi:hypothetical protein